MKIRPTLVVGFLVICAQVGCRQAGSQGCPGGRCGLPPASVYQQGPLTYNESSANRPGGRPLAAPAAEGVHQGSGSR